MRRDAMTDGLTAIANRKMFDFVLRQAALDGMENGDPLSLLMLDIDHFKKFNDTHGHHIGDQVLRLLASVLKQSVKGQDTPARYGGRAENLWADVPDGSTLLKRLNELPGFGAQKSKIFLALLGKQYGVTPPGWREAAGDYGSEGSRRSVADITGPESLAEVRAFKQEAKRTA